MKYISMYIAIANVLPHAVLAPYKLLNV